MTDDRAAKPAKVARELRPGDRYDGELVVGVYTVERTIVETQCWDGWTRHLHKMSPTQEVKS